MNIREVERLIEKYFNGETSINEEKALKEFFAGDEIPPHLESLKWQFRHFKAGKELAVEEGFVKQKLEKIPENHAIIRFRDKRRNFLRVAGIAASIIIFIAAMFQVNNMINRVDDNFSDQELAYRQAKQILYFVSKKLNNGTEDLAKVEKFDEGVSNLQSLEKFNTGLEQTGKVKKYNQLEKVLTTQ